MFNSNGSVLIKRKRDKKLRFFLIKSRILSKQNYSGIVLSHYYALVIFWKGCETQFPVIRRSLYTIITLRMSGFLGRPVRPFGNVYVTNAKD